MKLKLPTPDYSVGDMVCLSAYQVYKINSFPVKVMDAPHWKLLYYVTGLDWFREGWEYNVERV